MPLHNAEETHAYVLSYTPTSPASPITQNPPIIELFDSLYALTLSVHLSYRKVEPKPVTVVNQDQTAITVSFPESKKEPHVFTISRQLIHMRAIHL